MLRASLRVCDHRGLGALIALAASLAPAVAFALGPLYLRSGLLLTPVAPTSLVPLDDVGAYVGPGQTAVLAEFVSDPFPDEQQVISATVSLFLVTGRMGMVDCADVSSARR